MTENERINREIEEYQLSVRLEGIKMLRDTHSNGTLIWKMYNQAWMLLDGIKSKLIYDARERDKR